MKKILKRLSLYALVIGVLFTSLLALFPDRAFAAGETYTWKDYNTISVAGGDLTSGGDLVIVPSSGANPAFQSASINAAPNHKAGCKLFLIVRINTNAPTVTAPQPNSSTVGNIPSNACQYMENGNPKFPGVSAGYNNTPITVTGTRPNPGDAAETPAQKEVTLKLNAPDMAIKALGIVNIEIKNEAGQVVRTANVEQESALGSADPNSPLFVKPEARPVYYFTKFELEPGRYTVCDNYVIKDCRSFEKKKFQQGVLEYGEGAGDRKINVILEVGYIGGPKNMTVGPFQLALTRGSSVPITVDSETAEHKMTREEEQSNGGIEVTYTFNIPAVFNSVDPGIYTICVVGLAECQEVTKGAGKNAEVRFKIDWNKFSADNVYERDCTDKYDVMGVKGVTYLICSIIDTGTYAIGAIENALVDLLTVKTEQIFGTDDKANAFHNAWNAFRLFALALIVIGALLMIISQAAGLEIFSAYSVRRILPRILAAAIFISLSWPIMEFLVGLSNDAGSGIRTLIYVPFKALDVGGDIAGGSIFALMLVGTGGALFYGWMGLLSFVLTGLLAALVAFIILILRKLLLIFLVLMAPFAIAAKILPNTEGFWSVWKTTFGGVLVVFPIIIGFVAIGRAFSVTAFYSPEGIQAVNQLIAFIAYFAPYFMITLAFRLAGGIMGRVAGMVNDRGKGTFDRLKNFRSRTSQENLTKMKEGQRFSNSNRLARAFNRSTLAAGTVGRGRLNADQMRRQAAMRLADTQGFKAIEEDEDAMMAGTYNSASEAQTALTQHWGDAERARRAVHAVQAADLKFAEPLNIAAAIKLADAGTGYENMEEMVGAIARASGGDARTASVLSKQINTINKARGRHDLAPGFAGLNNAVQREAGIIPGGPLTQQDYHGPDGLYDAAWRTADPVTLASNRDMAYGNFMNHHVGKMENARRSYDAAAASGNQRAMHEAVLSAQSAEQAFYEQEESRMYMSGDNNAHLESATARVADQREWLGSMTRVGAERVTVLRRDPTNPNNIISEQVAPTYQAEARSRARVRTMGQNGTAAGL